MANRLDSNGTLYLIGKLLALFQRQEAGKGLSTNDLTNDLKAKILNQFDGTWASLTGKPTNVSTWTNDANYQTAAQVAALIEAAIEEIDTDLFVVVDELPEVSEANTNRIYVLATDSTEWFVKDDEWELIGDASMSLEGYFNQSNLVPITNTEIDNMIASLTE